MARIPNVFEQVFRTGDACTGVAYTGTGGGDGLGAGSQSSDGHIFRQTPLTAGEPAIDGGLIPLGGLDRRGRPIYDAPGYVRFDSTYVKAVGAANIALILVDTDGFEHVARSVSAAAMVDDLLSGVFVLPGWRAKITINTIGGSGAKIVTTTSLWFHPCAHNLT